MSASRNIAPSSNCLKRGGCFRLELAMARLPYRSGCACLPNPVPGEAELFSNLVVGWRMTIGESLPGFGQVRHVKEGMLVDDPALVLFQNCEALLFCMAFFYIYAGINQATEAGAIK